MKDECYKKPKKLSIDHYFPLAPSDGTRKYR
jgi:hypothetical protein